MYYGDRNGAVPCSNHVSLRHYQPSVCNAGYYFLQSLQILMHLNTFTAIVDLSRFNNSCLKSPASTLVDLTFQSRALRSFSLNQLRKLSL